MPAPHAQVPGNPAPTATASQSARTPAAEGSARPGTGAVGAVRRDRVSVDNNRCHGYGVCQQEAPDVFDLGPDGRLRYQARPDPAATDLVRQAARCCPMQAITIRRG